MGPSKDVGALWGTGFFEVANLKRAVHAHPWGQAHFHRDWKVSAILEDLTCGLGASLVILMPLHNGKCPIDLLYEKDTAHLMGQGKS